MLSRFDGVAHVGGVGGSPSEDCDLEEGLAGLDGGNAEVGVLGHDGVIGDHTVLDEITGTDLLREVAGRLEFVDWFLSDLAAHAGDEEVTPEHDARLVHGAERDQSSRPAGLCR